MERERKNQFNLNFQPMQKKERNKQGTKLFNIIDEASKKATKGKLYLFYSSWFIYSTNEESERQSKREYFMQKKKLSDKIN